MEDIVESGSNPQVNPYREMAPEARSVLRRLMYNSRNEKIKKETAMDILDRAGEAAQREQFVRPVVIKESQVVLLMQAAKEVIGG